MTFANGEFLGYLTMTQTATSARITAASSTFTGQSAAFDIAVVLADTAANSPASRLTIATENIPEMNQFTITWPGVSGKLYRIGTSPDLATWTNIFPLILATATGTQTITLDRASFANFFVRVQIAP